MAIDKQTINEIRTRFITENLDSEPDAPPDLQALADEFGVSPMAVRRHASVHNWRGFRQRNKDRFLRLVDDEFEKALQNVATNRAQAMADIVDTHLAQIKAHYPQLIEKLSMVMPTMDPTELMQYMKLLQTSSLGIMKMLQTEGATRRAESISERRTDAIQHFGSQIKALADMASAVKTGGVQDTARVSERTQAFERIDRNGTKAS